MRLKINKTGSFKFSKKYLKLISDANVYDVAAKTPITYATNMSAKANNEVFLKREDLQPVFFFMNRSTYNNSLRLTHSYRKKGGISAAV